MNLKQFLDSTYLKTASQAGISEAQNKKVATEFIQEAIDENFKLIMIRPEYVSLAKKIITMCYRKIIDAGRSNYYNQHPFIKNHQPT